MKYIFKKVQHLKLLILITIIMPFIIYMMLYPFLLLNKFEKMGTLIAYNTSMNQAIYYYLPILSVYLYLIDLLLLDYFERAYVYKFKSKFSLLKSNLISVLIFTVFYVFIINTVFLGLISLITDGYNQQLISLYFSSLILQILVLYIYSLVICICNYIVVKYITLASLIIKIGILLSGFISGAVLGMDYLGQVSLYSYFNVQSIYIIHQTVIWTVFLLLFIIFVLINILKLIVNKVDYLRYLDIKE